MYVIEYDSVYKIPILLWVHLKMLSFMKEDYHIPLQAMFWQKKLEAIRVFCCESKQWGAWADSLDYYILVVFLKSLYFQAHLYSFYYLIFPRFSLIKFHFPCESYWKHFICQLASCSTAYIMKMLILKLEDMLCEDMLCNYPSHGYCVCVCACVCACCASVGIQTREGLMHVCTHTHTRILSACLSDSCN